MMDGRVMGTFPHVSRQDSECFGLACAAVLSGRYPDNAAKCVARDLEITPKAGENLLAGHISKRSMSLLVKAYGPGFLLEVGAAMVGQSLNEYLETYIIENAERARLEQERAKEREARYRAQLHALRTGVAVSASDVRTLP